METPMRLTLANRTLYHGDNLTFLRTIPTGVIDLIATDPPFNKGQDFYAADRSQMEGTMFPDNFTWSDAKEAWLVILEADRPNLYKYIMQVKESGDDEMAGYLCWLGVRLLECQRILKPTGSLYLHLDHTAHAYVKVMLDLIFGRDNFRNALVWTYDNKLQRSGKAFVSLHEDILWYSKDRVTWTYEPVYDDKWKPSASQQRRLSKGYEVRKGVLIIYDEAKKEQAEQEFPGLPITIGQASQPAIGDVWNIPILNPMSKERTGYPTQKPLTVYERIIRASSNVGDLVLDPFSGSGTTLIAAENLGRKWAGADQQQVNLDQILNRLENSVGIEDKVNAEQAAKLEAVREAVKEGDLPQEAYDSMVARFAKEATAVQVLEPEDLVPYLDNLDTATHYQVQDMREYKSPKIRSLVKEMSRNEMKDILLHRIGIPACCWGCGYAPPALDDTTFLHLDHIHPVSKGGSNDLPNRAILCVACNIDKKDRLLTLEQLQAENAKKGRWYWNVPPICPVIHPERALEAVEAYLDTLEV